MPQQFEQHQGERSEQSEHAPLQAASASAQSQDDFDALDSVLDDIESTLETNAEEYVKSFVQKGGE